MSNIFSQMGLGQMLQGQKQFYSRQQQEELERDMLRAQTEQYRAKTQQALDPRYEQQQLPAAIQVGQHYAGLDSEGQRLFRESRGQAVSDQLARKGLQVDPATGQVVQTPGFGGALGDIGAAEIRGQIPAETAREQALTTTRVESGGRAQKLIELNERKAVIPELRATLGELERLSNTATYTTAGRARDLAIKESGGESQGAIDRVTYDSKIANVILPLLKQTFGAAFTVEEGKKLEATLGDVNASPRQKQAAIKAFLKQRENDINSKERELGQKLTKWGAPQQADSSAPKKNQKIDGYWFLGGDPADEKNYRKVK